MFLVYMGAIIAPLLYAALLSIKLHSRLEDIIGPMKSWNMLYIGKDYRETINNNKELKKLNKQFYISLFLGVLIAVFGGFLLFLTKAMA